MCVDKLSQILPWIWHFIEKYVLIQNFCLVQTFTQIQKYQFRQHNAFETTEKFNNEKDFNSFREKCENFEQETDCSNKTIKVGSLQAWFRSGEYNSNNVQRISILQEEFYM